MVHYEFGVVRFDGYILMKTCILKPESIHIFSFELHAVTMRIMNA